MIHSTLPNLRVLPIAVALLAGACGWSTAFAQTAPVPVTTMGPPTPIVTATTATTSTTATVIDVDTGAIRLTDEERDAILDESTEARAAAARGEPTDADRIGRGVHGEMGFMIGTNGTRGAYGTADIPLGENAGATVSFESSRFGYPRSRRR